MTYARFLHDFQWMSFKSRTVTPGWPGLPSTPETVPLYVTPNKSDKDDVPLNEKWLEYLEGINSSRGFKFIISPPAGWFNRNKLADSLGFGGNVVEIRELTNQAGRVKSFHYSDTPPSPNDYNFRTHPELIQKFTVITEDGGVTNPAEGIDVYTFLISRKPIYVPLARIEFFPNLPVEVTINRSLLWGLDIREQPTQFNKVVGKVGGGKTVSVFAYSPSATSVWGRIDEGWIPLCWYPNTGYKGPKYYTSWSMKTIPPVPPVS